MPDVARTPTVIAITPATGGITAPAGFRAGAVHSGIKPSPAALDLAVLAADAPASAAALFTTNLAQAARANDPYFLVIMQNAEELVAHKAVVDAIDGIAKEDLFYGVDHKATENVRKSWRGPCSSCGS